MNWVDYAVRATFSVDGPDLATIEHRAAAAARRISPAMVVESIEMSPRARDHDGVFTNWRAKVTCAPRVRP